MPGTVVVTGALVVHQPTPADIRQTVENGVRHDTLVYDAPVLKADKVCRVGSSVTARR